MKLVISNIAWTNEEETKIAILLQKLGVRYIEIALTKKWNDPTTASAEEVNAYKTFWKDHGIEVVAFQSMLYSRPNFQIFGSEQNRQKTLDYLIKFMRLASDFGAKAMVFGSPKNRQRGEMPFETAKVLAEQFFDQLGTAAQEHGTTLCLEPNAPQYGCDFITNAAQGIEVVKAVNNPGFRLHLDMGCMVLAGDDIQKSIVASAPYLEHFHISSPMLEQVESRSDCDHDEAAAALREIGYDRFVSIEMRPSEAGTNINRVERAVKFAQATYSS